MSNRLTINTLVDLIEDTLRRFADSTVLTTKEINAIKKCSECVQLDYNTITRNGLKKQACIKLRECWEQSPSLFVVLALSAQITQLGGIKDDSWVRDALVWWKQAKRPQGFQDAEILERLGDILPPILRQRPVTSTLQREDFVHFLQNYCGGATSFQISIPEAGPPYIELSREMCQDLLVFMIDKNEKENYGEEHV